MFPPQILLTTTDFNFNYIFFSQIFFHFESSIFNLSPSIPVLFLKMGPISSVSPHNFLQFLSQQGRLSNGDFERAPYAFNVSYDPIEVTGLMGWWVGGEAVGVLIWPDFYMMIFKKKLGGNKTSYELVKNLREIVWDGNG